MLEKLLIKNFQIWEKLVLDLEQITTLVGPNDVGKSAIIRALTWLCLNESQGEADIRKGANYALVRLWVDGHKITRKRSPNGNLYFLDGKVFRAVGKDVPEEIKQILNLSDVNFQRQLEPHFWLSLSAPKVSRELNQIVNLSVIDRSLSKITTRTKRTKTELEIVESRLKEAKDDRRNLKWVLEANIQLSRIELENKHIEESSSVISNLEVLLTKVQTYQKQKRLLEEKLTESQEIVSLGSKTMNLLEAVEDLETLIGKISATRFLIQIEIPKTEELQQLVDQYKLLLTETKELGKLTDSYKSGKDKLWEIENELKQTEEKLHKQMKGKCPICGQEIK